MLGIMVMPAVATAAFFKKSRLEVFEFIVRIVFRFKVL
jgi:hypothetical protein